MSGDGLGDLPVARVSTLVEQVHAELKERILDGRLAPGSEVPDSVIAKQMGISRAPVRDACNLLVQSGLLTKRQNHPYRVREISAGDLGELQLIRWGLESAAARYLVRTKGALTGVAEPLERMAAAAGSGDGRLSWQADVDFHLAFVRSAGLPELVRLHENVLHQQTVTVRELPAFVLPTQRHRHQEILDILAASQRDASPDAILRLLTVHLLTTRSEAEDAERLHIRHVTDASGTGGAAR